jgi:hypothetical protein
VAGKRIRYRLDLEKFMPKRTVLRGARALVGSELDVTPEAIDLLLEDDRIRAIEPAGTQSSDEVIELPGRLLVPGLINGHFHSHEHFHKGRVENRPLELWMHHVRAGLSVELTPQQTYLRTMIGAIEALRSGTTLVVDDLLPGSRINRACLEAAFQAYADIGIRALVGPSLYNRRTVQFPVYRGMLPCHSCTTCAPSKSRRSASFSSFMASLHASAIRSARVWRSSSRSRRHSAAARISCARAAALPTSTISR